MFSLFKISFQTSFSDEELDELQRRRPLRFLGIKMDWCGLENISINENFFRNNLHRTGLRETFIDELKLGIDSTSQQLIVKRMLDRITLLFVDEALFPDWFSVFRNYLHPRPTRSNLCQGTCVFFSYPLPLGLCYICIHSIILPCWLCHRE